MTQTTRRAFVETGISVVALVGTMPSLGLAGTGGLTQDQKDEYARVYRADVLTDQERMLLSDMQDNRLTLPSGVKNFEEFLHETPAMKALAAGLTPELGMLKLCHDMILDATAKDHLTEAAVGTAIFGERFGPARTSHAMAICHLAIFEAVNAIYQKYHSYRNIQSDIFSSLGLSAGQVNSSTASADRAILEAMYASLNAMYPKKIQYFDVFYNATLPTIGDDPSAQQLGADIGKQAASKIIDLRKTDHSDLPDLRADEFSTVDPLVWQIDPVVPLNTALGGQWWRVTPFVIASSDAHRPPPPPSVNDPAFVQAFKEVKRLGGDNREGLVAPRFTTRTERTGKYNDPPFDDSNQSFKAIFWAYDGTPGLCAPPRLYNMIATRIALNERPIGNKVEFARLLALVNISMADAGIAAWEAKYHYALARPVTAIRNLSVDATAEGARDPRWTPLGAPVTNGGIGSRNLTPPFPAYPSGHATFGGALFETLRIVLRQDDDPADFDGVPFDFISDEYNNLNRQPGDTSPRPKVVRHFTSFSAAETENGDSRIWLGIHWDFDKTAGITQGKMVAQDVCTNILQKIA